MDMMLLCQLHVRNATSIFALHGPDDGKFILPKGSIRRFGPDPEELRKKLDSSFQVTANQVCTFSSGMTVADILLLVPKDQIIKEIGYGEHDETYDDYEIYDTKKPSLNTTSRPTKRSKLAHQYHRCL